MNTDQFIRWLRKQHHVRTENKGGRHPLIARRGNRKSVIPKHGGRKQLGKGLMKSIMRDLEITGPPPN